MLLPRLGMAAALTLLILPCTAAGAAQDAGTFQVAQLDDGTGLPEGGADDPADGSAMVVRIGRLEGQIRALTGQIEQLQFQNRRLEDTLRKMQGDIDFRFQDLQRSGGAPATRPAAPQKRSEADPAAVDGALASAGPETGEAPPPVPAAPRAKAARVGDAFDPDSNPTAPGAPRPLGTTAPSPAIAPRPTATPRTAAIPNAPLDLMQRSPAATTDSRGEALAPAVIPAPAAMRDLNAVASLAPGGTRDEYDADLGLYRQGQYDDAASGFQAFATKYPRDRLVPDAFYMAGESYARLGRHREAAEQFLKVSTDYGKSPRAPDALLRLGMSLNALGAKDQACATYMEVGRRYPTASQPVRDNVDRELKRARCPGNG